MTVKEQKYFEQPLNLANGREVGSWIVGTMLLIDLSERVQFRILTDKLAGVVALLVDSNYTVQGYSGSENGLWRTISVWREQL